MRTLLKLSLLPLLACGSQAGSDPASTPPGAVESVGAASSAYEDTPTIDATADGATNASITWAAPCGPHCAEGRTPTGILLSRDQAVIKSYPFFAGQGQGYYDQNLVPGRYYTYSICVTYTIGASKCASSTMLTPGGGSVGTGGGGMPIPTVIVAPKEGTTNIMVHAHSSAAYDYYRCWWGYKTPRGDVPITHFDTDSGDYDVTDTTDARFDIGPADSNHEYYVQVSGCYEFLGIKTACSVLSDTVYTKGPVVPQIRWHDPAPLPAPVNGPVFKTGGSIAAVSRLPSLLNTYTIGFDGQLWSAGDWFGEAWHDPLLVVGAQSGATFVPGGGLAAVSRTSSILETYSIGYDGQLWNTGWWMADSWRPSFSPIPTQATFVPGGGIAAVSRRPDVLDTFAIGYDGLIWDTGRWDSNGWHGAYQLPHNGFTFKVGGGIAAVSRDQDHIDLFVIGNDGQLWNAGDWQTDHWNMPYKIPTDPNVKFPVGGQIAVTFSDGYINTWVIGTDKQLWNAGSWNGSWHNPYKVPTTSGAVFVPGGGLAAVSRMSTLINLLSIGYDQKAWSNGWLGVSF